MIPHPPPAVILADEFRLDPDTAAEWIVSMWWSVVRLAEEVEELRGYVADLQGEVGL